MNWTKIMECVPNFSEGRDLQKIDEIVSPFRAKAGVKLLDYSNDEDHNRLVDRILRSSMLWDVMGGVARRSWARNPHAMETSAEFNESHADGYHITLPHLAEDSLINKILKDKGIK